MNLTLAQTNLFTIQLTMVAIVLQTMELIALRPMYSNQGPWSWQIMRYDFVKSPKRFRQVLDMLFAPGVFNLLTSLQLLIAIALLANARSPWAFSYLFLASLLVSVRFRGSFNGGSDAMMLVLLSALTVAGWFSHHQWVVSVAMFYIGIQCALSYLVAGLVKLKNPEWRSGVSLSRYVADTSYDVPPVIRQLARNKTVAKTAAWASIIFELGFVSIFWLPSTAPIWLIAGTIFHIINFAIFGLNRFVFAWLATYPAVLYLVWHSGI